jgi:tRNA dimethylallyltransferase
MNGKQAVVCLMGPTASGKTAIACELVQHFPCEIVSVDSAMIYCDMDIGTAKPDAATLLQAPHHLIDILAPTESYSAAQFCQDALDKCELIFAKGKIPLLVGGTMMYFHALQQGLARLPSSDEAIRMQLWQQGENYGWDHMHQLLVNIDAVSAQKIHPHDKQRIQRALEVYQLTGKPLSSHLQAIARPSHYQFINILLLPNDRAWLHKRIALRFEQMLRLGLVDETKQLISKWQLTSAHTAMRCVGYRQVMDYLDGVFDYDQLSDKGIAATRQLAKRQLTWLRHWSDGHRFEAEDQSNIASIAAIFSSECFR